MQYSKMFRGNIGKLESWKIPIFKFFQRKYWNTGILQNSNFPIVPEEILECWNPGKFQIGILEYWNPGTFQYWNFGILVF